MGRDGAAPRVAVWGWLTVEINAAVVVGVDLGDKLVDLLDAGVQAERLHGNLELLGVDGTWCQKSVI
ncbi:hypothetical protein CTA1_9413 [Colletotrichum tanaceti]|uniref:Uncharacterized protein n=1 Tax=Colletotrichum tanaceti TaxID=1306861 RepID=A0A4U6XLN7_9PEZI|nr:hypothetical protein CTA1_9413 [Colletotrichum tanaceti]